MTEMIGKRYILVDQETGLIVASFDRLPSCKDSNGKGFFMLWEKVIHDEDMSKADTLLFLKICTIMEPGGWVGETQRSIAAKFKLDYSNVVKGMGRLVKAGYMEKAEHKGGLWFKVNNEHAHKGPLIYRKGEIK